ncbi:Arabinanase/levansucrase/invertase superfamily protein [Mycena venus]|uniref:Arabinanase/levansucrase/invertase superfamily protein n=1 Tax=Mycena venus TaxID=2733690 RepID=A0A8H7DF18_9AGAR|nr:Arabinanase/levansucrase/invertase superfamily protein [Mycena venus]
MNASIGLVTAINFSSHTSAQDGTAILTIPLTVEMTTSASGHVRKTVLITGPGGIGYELAKEYHAQGLRVFATARRSEALLDLASLGLPHLETLELDVTKIESIQTVRDRIASLTAGTLDLLVNNAVDEVKAMFEVNVFGVIRMVQEFAPLLIASGDGRIVNIGSISGVMPYPFGSSYNASKAALHSYGNTLRLELAPFNVQVITIITGGVKSNISRNRRLIQPSSIYAPIADIFAKQRAARSQGMSRIGAMATEVYAKQVVAQTLKHHVKAWFWTGNFSFSCWFVDTFFGRRGFDWILSSMFGLSRLRTIITNRKKQN